MVSKLLSKGGSVTGFVQNQGTLEHALRALFPQENILVNVRKELKTRSTITGSFLEFDIWIPSFHLCFEFQDPYHYTTTWETNKTLHFIRARDEMKNGLARANGDTLVIVPCWWDGSNQSLAHSISFYRPDIIINNFNNNNNNNNLLDEYIPLNPPSSLFLIFDIPIVGELMLASFPPLQFKRSISPENPKWMGEKYDGIRACWNPHAKQINATTFQLPESFYKSFSDHFLDGEFWFGRGYFVDSQRLAFSSVQTNWQLLRYVVFDDPSPYNNLVPFEKRYEGIIPHATTTYFINMATRMLCNSGKQLTVILKELLEGEGEGVIMRKPKSLYEHGRSNNLVKLKAARGDREGLVTQFDPSNNSYTIQLPEGTHFTVPAPQQGEEGSEGEREAENERMKERVKEGDVVTFSYEGMTRTGLPIMPLIIRKREDVSWQHILSLHDKEAKSKSLNEISQKLVGPTPSQPHKTRIQKKQSLRLFYERLARHLLLDPLDPDTWYNLSRSSILAYKGGASALVYYDGSLSKSFIDLFPELKLEEYKFAIAPHKYWGSMENRRKFFEDYATQYGFDPLVPDNWYSNMEPLKYHKGGETVRSLYNGSFSKALFHSFPELKFNETQFVLRGYWTDTKNVRRFFERLARDNGFDPLIPSNWYSISKDTIFAQKLGRSVLGFYDNIVSKALIDNFPEIGLNQSKFPPEHGDHWKDANNRRIFFEEFAESRGMDYKSPDTWYSIPPSDFTTNKQASQILKHYGGITSKAIMNLFPEIGLEQSRLPKQFMYWRYDENKRIFFEKFAKKNNFNPLIAENWYKISSLDIVKAQAGKGIRLLDKGGFVSTLCNVFPEVAFDKLRFANVALSAGYFKSFENRRAVLLKFAEDQQFDPLISENWYSVKVKPVELAKGGKALMHYYGYRLRQAIIDLFPELTFDLSKFSLAQSYWSNKANRRAFFEDYAKERGFDPLEPENWYSVSSKKFLKAKAGGLLFRYKGSSIRALMDQFPEIGLTLDGFKRNAQYWKSVDNRRKLFSLFAKKRNFDPYILENWTPELKEEVRGEKNLFKVMKYYSNIDKALEELFST